jgi:uncharacterized protein YfaS (alpha-2-macroglobulin family)
MRWTVVAALVAFAAPLEGQYTRDSVLRVLRHTPDTQATAGASITITFDRPVAGALDRSVDASRIFRVEPAVQGEVAWRDPVTIRFRPRAPLPPGVAFTVTVDTTFTAIDGSKLAAPFTFGFRVAGATLLAHVPSLYDGALGPDEKVRLLYSAPVDLALLDRVTRLELDCEGKPRVELKPVVQRPLDAQDDYRFQYAGGYDRDTVGDRFRRVVELAPESPIPGDCTGRLVVLRSIGADGGAQIDRHPISSRPSFRLLTFACPSSRSCDEGVAMLSFTTPVAGEQVMRYVRLEPRVPFTLDTDRRSTNHYWALRVKLLPRTKYRLVIDTALRDVHDRRLVRTSWPTIQPADYAPLATLGAGLVTVPKRGSRLLAVQHVNVDSALLTLYRVPRTARAAALSTNRWWEGANPWEPTGRTVEVRWPLRASFNKDTTTLIPLDELEARVGGAGLLAVRVDVAVSKRPPEWRPVGSLGVTVVGEPPPSGVGALPFALVQSTDLVAHAKIRGASGTVFVTRLSDGRAQPDARVTLYDARDVAMAYGTTDAVGLATLTPLRRQAARPRSTAQRDPDAVNRSGVPSRYVEVAYENDRSITPIHHDWSVDEDGYHYYASPSPLDPERLGGRQLYQDSTAGLVFTERGIYRPGETVFAKGVVRVGMLGFLRIPERTDSVRWLFQYRRNRWDDDAAETIRDTVVALSAFGTALDSMRLRPTAALGHYTVRLQLRRRDDTVTVADASFRVAEYRSPEFLVDLATSDSLPRFAGDTVRAIVAARYLFGALMGSARVQWSTATSELSAGDFTIPHTAGWIIGGDRDWSHDDSAVDGPSGQTTLDAAGQATLRIAVPPTLPARPSRLHIHTAITDVNRQVVTASTSLLVHPAAIYIAARQTKSSWWWNVGSPQPLELRTVHPDGREVSRVTVHVTVMRRSWMRGRRDGAGSSYGEWQTVVDTIRRDSVVTAQRPTVYTFTPREGGEYLVRFTARDEQGRAAVTALSAYAMGGQRSWTSDSPYRLPLVATGERLSVGDTAAVTFESPFDRAEAWLTVEREGLLEQRRFTVTRGTKTERIAIAERHVPNVFVSLLLVNQTSVGAASPDSAPQVLRAGYTELRVDPAVKRLRVTVAVAPRELGPGDTPSITVDVRDRRGVGVKSEVTLWAVDEGVLALTAYEMPDLLQALYTDRGVGLRLRSTLTSLLFDPALLDATRRRAAARQAAAGRAAARRSAATQAESARVDTVYQVRGDTVYRARLDTVTVAMPAVYPTSGMEVPDSAAEIPLEILRSKFRSTAFFVGNVVTNESGRAIARVKVPDNLTSYSVLAVAVGDGDRYGGGTASFLVTRPLVARPALPRFVRASDSLVAGTVVNSRDGAAHEVRVDAEADNARLVGPARQSVPLLPGRGGEARFTFVVPPRDSARGAAVFRFGAVSAAGRDAVETRLDVRPDFHPRTHTVVGIVRDTTAARVLLPAAIDPARSRLTLRLGTSPLVPMLAAYDRLRVYPYYCTEQLTSGGRALVAIYHATRGQERRVAALGPDPVAAIQRLADELALRQSEDGAIGFWRATDWSSPWLSAYAGLFLLDARTAGVTVEQRIIDKLARYLSAAAADTLPHGGENPTDRFWRRARLGERVAAIEFLRRAGRPDRGAEDQLLARAGDMLWEDRLRLAETVAARPDVASRARELVDDAWRAVTAAGARVDLPDTALTRRDFPSHIRPAARLLTATLALRPDHALVGALVETVLQQGRAERSWAWNTQDYASVVTALARLGGETSSDVGRRVAIVAGGQTLLDRVVRSPVAIQDREGGAAEPAIALTGLLRREGTDIVLPLKLVAVGQGEPIFYSVTVEEVPLRAPVTPDVTGIAVERWYERFDDGRPATSVAEGELVRVRLRITVPADRQFVVVDDALPAGLEPVDLSLRTSATLGPFSTVESEDARDRGDRDRDGPRWQPWLYGSWDNGWWSPWDHKEIRDDRVVYFARALWKGTYTASYVARATTRGRFVRPPAHAEEMYNPGVHGRSDGGSFEVRGK